MTANLAAERRRRRRDKAVALAATQNGVLSRRQLYAAGFTRGEVRANLRAGRWRRLGVHCLVLHAGALDGTARHWAAVLESGPRAFIDGESALVLAGLERYQAGTIRVSVPRGARIRHRGSGLNLRQTRRWNIDDIEPLGVPRSRVPVAAVRAALWAASDRQAALLLTMTVQQRLATVEELALEMLRVRRDKRRGFIHTTLLDLAGGIRSLGELDVVRGCRDRDLPEPDKQVLCRSANGTYYLDFRWNRWQVVVEVDGIQHAWAENIIGDAIRHNSIAMSGDVVLRLPILGLRVCPDDFFSQIEQALTRAGWRRPGAAA